MACFRRRYAEISISFTSRSLRPPIFQGKTAITYIERGKADKIRTYLHHNVERNSLLREHYTYLY